MYSELVLDGHTGAWVPFDLYKDEPIKKTPRFNVRSGFYPYEYNFLFGRRDGIIQCSYCGVFFPTRAITRDHIYPKSKGGQLTTPACYPCNEAKQDKLPIEWAISSAIGV